MARTKRPVNRAYADYSPRTWQQFLDQVMDAREALKFQGTEECFFRGHADSEWELLPSLMRDSKRLGFSKEKMIEVEGSLFWEFQARAQELHLQPLTDWDYLFYMRHYGVSTRVLDWTEGLGVALFFALEDARKHKAHRNPCVWLLNPYSLNEHPDAWAARDLVSPRYLGYIRHAEDDKDSEDQDLDYGDLIDVDPNESEQHFHWKLPVAIYPIQRSNRVRAQRGWFTIQGSNLRALEAQAPGSVARVLLPQHAFQDALRFLTDAGLNDYTIYADLDGLARELHNKNGLL